MTNSDAGSTLNPQLRRPRLVGESSTGPTTPPEGEITEPVVHVGRRLGRGRTGETFFGLLADVPAAIKVAHAQEAQEELRHETSFYAGPLRELEGDVVPHFVGLYEGVWNSGRVLAAVMEYVGEPIGVDEDMAWGWFSLEDRTAIRTLYRKLHEKGVSHGDMRMANTMRAADGKIRLVDFADAMTETLESEANVADFYLGRHE
ncbi:hypothetical protein CC85DRAFT_299742 [Cutaneotrichosporon oleaginosum]|uniref:Protein kinase domain-containing protein n=1 Tax=Cutaneotrichosporon oleaginosum TaxID=879819 RepID=A0A0J0XW18_9TREE|nr:uncharacterized protein CC85DRAFT_299742 [Cutaneotrichosporon oleaginosum]KLT45282.1 hypothetical protein CC85DRAFT_299742 [Cutaneotrichosporon oleaginosum]TXT14889.1 hypothetical protein COLE_01082 [Cutaneotrichosporon oleaginosum]